ncbi:hypothetical protein SAMN05216266_101464 [Amycolatopsis marina]|uniref:Uncharacterized protein n=1 Tax=Amycolatopsis marina TaxID=490629 RepID=A0A1I0VSW9_9PSEU|nr:hypothetical protein [Amycolatopsis marina]SFA79318.1 hypothetical protein SAMN05216266_101464 [Amycolatopsis marina]
MVIQHANSSEYLAAVRTAMDEFEEALRNRYTDSFKNWKTGGNGAQWTLGGALQPQLDPAMSDDEADRIFQEATSHVPKWAAEIRADAESAIPVYDSQELNELNSAVEQMNHIAQLLEFNGPALRDKGEISDITNEISSAGGEWQGVSADKFGEDFGKSAEPTKENQRDIAVSLAKLYSARAAVISSIRGHTLTSIRQATEQLGATVDSGAESVRWTMASVFAIIVGFAGPVAAVATSVAAIVGSIVDPADPDQKFENDIGSVVAELKTALEDGKNKAVENETEYSAKVTELQDAITEKQNAEPRNLELYDFTSSGESVGQAEAGGYTYVRATIERLAKACYLASEKYEPLINHAIATDDADPQLKGINNTEQSGDVYLKDTRDTFVSFLQTTCARYREAGDRLMDAAREYDNAETNDEDILTAIGKELDFNGDESGTETVTQHVGATPGIEKHWNQ